MFVSFFPAPRPFFWSAVLWTLAAVLFWFFVARDAGHIIGLENPAPNAPPIVGISRFWSKPFLWFYLYYAVVLFIFAGAWRAISDHPWFNWSVLGTGLIVFIIYFQVEVSVSINYWYRDFFDLIQKALDPATRGTVSAGELYAGIGAITGVLLTYITIAVMTAFFSSHYIFRWRKAMNDFYTRHWHQLRNIEGASQRVQEDTMQFAKLSEGLGANLVSAVMTLIAFLPVLAALSNEVSEVPVLGAIPYSLVVVSLLWSIFGTALLALVGIRLPGLEFHNQRVEAAYRKELVYGEDHADRAQPPALRDLFVEVQRNYFRLYFNYLYFNVARYGYLQADMLVPFFVLIPAVAAGAITLGFFTQVRQAFGEVRDSMQYLVRSWSTIVDFLSIYKRLRAFESTIHGDPLSAVDQAYLDSREST